MAPSWQSLDALDAVHQERIVQDAQWGGAAHDDQHRPELWDGLRWKFLRRAALALDVSDDRAQRALRRKRLVQIAAIAVAAIESMDRRTKG